MADFNQLPPGLAGYVQGQQMDQQTQQNALAALLSGVQIQHGIAQQNALARQLAVKDALGKALMGDSASTVSGAPAMSNADRLMAAAQKVGDYDAYQEAVKQKIEEKKLGPKFKADNGFAINPATNKLEMWTASDVDGKPVFQGVAPKPNIHMVTLGGTTQAVDENTVPSGTVYQHTQTPDSIASNKVTMRGQNMTDARARQQIEQGRNQVVQSDNGPVLVNTTTGAGKVISGPDGKPLPGIVKPLNEGQSKALLFGTRMQEADKILSSLAKEGTDVSVPGSRAPIIGGAISALSTGNQQMLNQAKLDFMTAVLRRESGAAISSGEYANADKQYFPQLGDSDKVIKQKAANRRLAIAGVLSEVPEKSRGSITPTQDIHAQADAILRGQ